MGDNSINGVPQSSSTSNLNYLRTPRAAQHRLSIGSLSSINASRCRKVSTTGLSDISDTTQLQIAPPTYQLKPAPTLYSHGQLSKMSADILELYLRDVDYTSEICHQKAKDIAKTITDRVKRFSAPRFRVVTLINMGNVTDYISARLAGRCLWDEQTDSCITAVYSNKSLYCVATTYIIYQA